MALGPEAQDLVNRWNAGGRLSIAISTAPEGNNSTGKLKRAEYRKILFNTAFAERRLFSDIATIVENEFLRSTEVQEQQSHQNSLSLDARDTREAIAAIKRIDFEFLEFLEGKKDAASLEALASLRRPILQTSLGIRDRIASVDLEALSPNHAAYVIMEIAFATYEAAQLWRISNLRGIHISDASSVPEESLLSAVLRSIKMQEATEKRIAKELDSFSKAPYKPDFFTVELLLETGFPKAACGHILKTVGETNALKHLTKDVFAHRSTIQMMLRSPAVNEMQSSTHTRHEIPWNSTHFVMKDGLLYGCNGEKECEGILLADRTGANGFVCMQGDAEEVILGESFLAPVSTEIDSLSVDEVDHIVRVTKNLIHRGRARLLDLWNQNPKMFAQPAHNFTVFETDNDLKVFDWGTSEAKRRQVPEGWSEIESPKKDVTLRASGLEQVGAVRAIQKIMPTTATPIAAPVLPEKTTVIIVPERAIRDLLHRRGELTFPQLTHVLSTLSVTMSTQGKGSHESLHSQNGQATVGQRWRDETRKYTPAMALDIIGQLNISADEFLYALQDYYGEI